MRAKKIVVTVLALTNFIHLQSLAEEYAWQFNHEIFDPKIQGKHTSPDSACRWAFDYAFQYYADYHPVRPSTQEDRWWFNDDSVPNDHTWVCAVQNDPNVPTDQDRYPVKRIGSTCLQGKEFNKFTGQCEAEAIEDSCPSSTIGNPINFLTGYKIQSETDFASLKNVRPNQIEFSRFYSSINGAWIHNYSSRLIFESNLITLFHSDGKKSSFDKTENSYTPKQPELGKLTKHSEHWSYHSPENALYEFDNLGRLSKITKHGVSQLISHTNNEIIISDAHGMSIQISEDSKKQPIKLITKNMQIDYKYNTYLQLTSVTRKYPDSFDRRQYLYEDTRDSRLLTAIIDERGEKSATWAYDEQGRAISSEHADSAAKVLVSYNTDGSTTVTNELGKKTNYKYESIQGVRRITSIDGEPTISCPKSNSIFTYDERGLLKTQVDNKGNTTTYTYNDRNLESSRTQASGTPQARTISTEWHPSLFLPILVTEPDRITKYAYDDQGRQLNKSITPR